MAGFYYKCRMCGQIFKQAGTSDKLAVYYLLNAMYDIPLPSGTIGGEIRMLSAHSCEDGSMGVADLMGYKKD